MKYGSLILQCRLQSGLLPYRDISMITTPLFYIVNSIFLRVLKEEMLVMRILGILQEATILFMMFKIMRRLKINKDISLISIIRNLYCFFRFI